MYLVHTICKFSGKNIACVFYLLSYAFYFVGDKIAADSLNMKLHPF